MKNEFENLDRYIRDNKVKYIDGHGNVVEGKLLQMSYEDDDMSVLTPDGDTKIITFHDIVPYDLTVNNIAEGVEVAINGDPNGDPDHEVYTVRKQVNDGWIIKSDDFTGLITEPDFKDFEYLK